MTICGWTDCNRKAIKRGYCNSHYERLRLSGALKVERRGQVDRFWSKVVKSDGCWIWTGLLSTGGYGRMHFDGRTQQAHRIAYELLVGPIPDGLHVDHLCRERRCVNPSHMEPVTPGVNVLRGVGVAAMHARQTHCVNGHPLSGDNLRINSKGWRECRACDRERAREKARLNRQPVTVKSGTCVECGRGFDYYGRKGRKICSQQCRDEVNRRSAREYGRRKRSGQMIPAVTAKAKVGVDEPPIVYTARQ